MKKHMQKHKVKKISKIDKEKTHVFIKRFNTVENRLTQIEHKIGILQPSDNIHSAPLNPKTGVVELDT